MIVNRTVCPPCNGISFNTQDFPMNGPDLEQKQMIVFIWRVAVVVVIRVNGLDYFIPEM